jgi:hypothetical protein
MGTGGAAAGAAADPAKEAKKIGECVGRGGKQQPCVSGAGRWMGGSWLAAMPGQRLTG